MRILDAVRGEEEGKRREEEDGEGTSEARTRALNEILRGTEVVGSLARPLGSCSAGWPVAALVAQLPPGLVRVLATTTRAMAAPPMGELDGRREMGLLSQSEAATWAGLARESPSVTRHEVLATAHASTHHALALCRILMRNRAAKSWPFRRSAARRSLLAFSFLRDGWRVRLPHEHSSLLIIIRGDKGDDGDRGIMKARE